MTRLGTRVKGPLLFVIVDPSPQARWGRLPLQLVLIAWAWWYTEAPEGTGDS